MGVITLEAVRILQFTMVWVLGFSWGLAPTSWGQATISGTLTGNVTLGAAESPWRVGSTVTVPAGATLLIEAGVRVEFAEGSGLVVEGGRLVAEGTEAEPIVFSRPAAEDHEWDGFRFVDTYEDNRLRHFTMEHGDDRDESITVERSRLTISFGSWPTTEETMIEMDEPAVLIEDSEIPGISSGEVIHGENLVAPGYLILRRNVFGKASNGGDVLDFSGAEAPGPILQIIDNVFEGGDDDGLDLDGTDAFVSGNVFMNFRKGSTNGRATTSNAIATGLPQSGAPNRTRVTLVRNLFLNCDHAVLLKEEAFLTAVNNTFVGMEEAVIQFNEEGGTRVLGPGKGAVLDGNIFWDNRRLFKYVEEETELTVHRCVIDRAFHGRGEENFAADPGFVNPAGGDYSLREGSPAIGTGPNGLDRGFAVPEGASISGEPWAVTSRSEASLRVGGPDIVQYRYRLNGGAWSEETPVGEALLLAGLGGVNSVEVIGKNSVGAWQSGEEATESESWTVDSDLEGLWLSEVDAPGGRVELVNRGATPRDVNGCHVNSVRITGAAPIAPHGHLVVAVPTLGLSGGVVTLLDGMAETLDVVEYGLQVEGSTIARLGSNAQWGLAQPTLAGPNRAQPLALRGGLKVNEWLLNADSLYLHDFVELFNPADLPVPLAGLRLEVEPRLAGSPWLAPPLSFVGATGHMDVIADGDPGRGAHHADFDGSGALGTVISLFDGGVLIDEVQNNSADADVSGGRVPSGGAVVDTFVLPTPGRGREYTLVETVLPLVAVEDEWLFEDSDTDLGTEWREPGFDDGAWARGRGVLGRETSPDDLPEELLTEVNYEEGVPTYYFRKAFDFVGDPSRASLRMRTIIDDGAVFYLNGQEFHRLRMDDPVSHSAFANDNVGNADYEGPFVLPGETLRDGENILAVEAHQDDDSSSDIVFGLALEAVQTEQVGSGMENIEAVLAGLRLTEVMVRPSAGEAAFLEFANMGNASLELEGLRFTRGLDFVFPPMTLGPGELVYVVGDSGSFDYPGLRVAGFFGGDPGGSAQRIRLELPIRAAVVDVSFEGVMAAGVDGGGNSLELVDGGGLKSGRILASQTRGGSPGRLPVYESEEEWLNRVFTPEQGMDPLLSGATRDPDRDGLANLLERLLGLDPNARDLEALPDPWMEGEDLVWQFPRATAAGDAQLKVTGSVDLQSWTTEIPGLKLRVISEERGMQVMEARIPAPGDGRYFLRLEGELK